VEYKLFWLWLFMLRIRNAGSAVDCRRWSWDYSGLKFSFMGYTYFGLERAAYLFYNV
jgi:hypothetical protein